MSFTSSCLPTSFKSYYELVSHVLDSCFVIRCYIAIHLHGLS